jgi:hypothetical protein
MKFSTRMKGRIPERAIEYLLAEPGGDMVKQVGAPAVDQPAPHLNSQDGKKNWKKLQ